MANRIRSILVIIFIFPLQAFYNAYLFLVGSIAKNIIALGSASSPPVVHKARFDKVAGASKVHFEPTSPKSTLSPGGKASTMNIPSNNPDLPLSAVALSGTGG